MEVQKIKEFQEKRKAVVKEVKNYSYYIIIGVVSVIVMFVVPLLTGCLQGDLDLYFPTTPEEWVIYIVVKISGSLGNVGVFILFKLQAKSNVKDDPNYIEANQILNKVREKRGFIPRSPKQMNIKDYTRKGVMVFLSTLMTSVIVTNLILSWDLITFISCVISTIIALAFGWVAMLKDEVYWTDEYLLYAKYIQKQEPETEKEELVC